ncbi:unnamed protein product [Amaranthus hypochondriacus]
MENPKLSLTTMLVLYLSLVFLWCKCNAVSNLGMGNITSIFQLGDSLSDTGNLIIESPNGLGLVFSRLPYGVSFFNHPTGRCSNGLLMIDYLARALNVPRLNPYLNKEAMFTHGANFAVAGATALPAESLADRNIVNHVTNSSLSVQLDWMWSHLNSICYDDQDCVEKLQHSLIIVGEIGSNDYFYAFSQGKKVKEVFGMVFDVVQAIIEGVMRTIQIGASKIIVPGIFPLGYFPAYTAAFRANNSANYREHILLNKMSVLHNHELQKRLQLLNQDYRNITILYADYYNAFIRLLHNATHFGFNGTSDVRKACCGIGGRLSFNLSRMCGARGVPVCANPDEYFIWDGINLTQRAYRILARWLFRSTISFNL